MVGSHTILFQYIANATKSKSALYESSGLLRCIPLMWVIGKDIQCGFETAISPLSDYYNLTWYLKISEYTIN